MEPTLSSRIIAVLAARRSWCLTALALAAALAWSAPASAQLSRVGNTVGLADVWVFGTDPCYDSTRGVYLVVGGQGYLWGVFADAAGQRIGSAFRIGSSNDNKPYGLFPRCAFSPQANNGQGGFLVTWHQDDSVNFVHSLVAAYPGGVVPNSEQVLSDGTQGGSNFRFGSPIAYSPTSQTFLVAFGTNAWNIQGRFVGVNGVPSGGIFGLANAPTNGGMQYPELTWNSSANEFGMSLAGWDDGGAFVSFRRISASNGAVASSPRFGYAAGTFPTDVDYNPGTNRYVMGWSSGGARGAELDAQGNVLSERLLSTRIGTPTSFSMAHNPLSGTFLAISEDTQSYDIAGLELDGAGVPKTAVDALTNGGGTNGSYFPRVGARTDAKEWNISFARQFTSIADQIIRTDSNGSGGGSPPPPPPAGTQPLMALDYPTNGASFTGSFMVSGWALDLAATSGTGVDAVHVWAFPTSGGQTFLGAATYGNYRPDLGAIFGAQFTYSGFSLTASLPAGSYRITAFMHDTLTGTFNLAQSADITVTTPTSSPLMVIDRPVAGDVAFGSTISGWALDLGAASGPGVDAVHVWALPVGDTQYIWVGAANFGQSRPDLGAIFGAQFTNSGYSLGLNAAQLIGRQVDLTVFARSTVTGHWFARVVRITVY